MIPDNPTQVLLSFLLLLVYLQPSRGERYSQNTTSLLRGSNHHDLLSPNITLNQRERRAQNDNCPHIKDEFVHFELDKLLFDTIFECAKMMDLDTQVQTADELQDNNKANFETFQAWKHCSETHILAKTFDQQCIVYFAPWNDIIVENLRNLDPFVERIEGTDCKVRAGYARTYDKTPYGQDFRNAIDNCVNSCGGTQCPLFMTGYSQAGGHAVIASIDFRRYNPVTVTFGATPSILTNFFVGDKCTDFDANQHYQFVNLFDDGAYDFVAMSLPNPFGASHFGHMMFLDGVNHYMIGYAGFNNRKARRPCTLCVHSEPLYLERIRRIHETGCIPVPVAKWSEGHVCHYDDECGSFNCDCNVCQP